MRKVAAGDHNGTEFGMVDASGFRREKKGKGWEYKLLSTKSKPRYATVACRGNLFPLLSALCLFCCT